MIVLVIDSVITHRSNLTVPISSTLALRQHSWDSNTRYRDRKSFWDGVPLVKGYTEYFLSPVQTLSGLYENNFIKLYFSSSYLSRNPYNIFLISRKKRTKVLENKHRKIGKKIPVDFLNICLFCFKKTNYRLKKIQCNKCKKVLVANLKFYSLIFRDQRWRAHRF